MAQRAGDAAASRRVIAVRRRDGRPLRIGHRGAAALEPENTLASFERAVAEGVDLIEFDVVALADGTLVVAHSDDLYEVSHGAAHGRVRSERLADLRRVAPALPTLDDALGFFRDRAPETGLHLDLKWFGYEEAVVAAVRAAGVADRTLASSFFVRSLRAVGSLEPALRLGLSYPLDRYRISRWRPLAPAVLGAVVAMRQTLPRRIGGLLEEAGATVATLNYLVVSRAVIARCHERGAAVFVWTVDEPRALRRLVAAGVDGVITNDPRIFAGTLTP